jgi:chemotaxis response regulator CheB
VSDNSQAGPLAPTVPFFALTDLQRFRCSVVVIAASTGGLAAISTILAALPSDFPAAIAIVQHRAPQPSTMLESLLSRVTQLVVKTAESGDRIQAGTIYIAPPDFHMLIDDPFPFAQGPLLPPRRRSALPVGRRARHLSAYRRRLDRR